MSHPRRSHNLDWDALCVAGLYLAGLLLWAYFLDWGNVPSTYHDWQEVNLPRLASIQDALRRNELPLHFQDAAILRCGPGCDRFFSAVDAISSPQILLLKWLPLGAWVLFQIEAMYALGFWGLLALRRRFGLSLPLFLLAYGLVFFNGHIIAHLSVGHLTWGGYFLFPWLVLLVERFIRGDDSWAWVLQTSLLLFFIFLQGSFHQFVWALIFLAFLGLAYFRRFLTVFKALVFACLVSAFRLLPPALSFGSFDRDFYGGYPSLFAVYEALTHWVPPAEAMPFMHQGSNLGFWEFDLYVGKLGLALLLLAGLAWLLNMLRARRFDGVLLPIAALALLSYDHVYLFFSRLPIPLLAGERVTTRILSLAFVFFVLYALAALQKWFPTAGRARLLVAGAASLAAAALAAVLLPRFFAWRVTQAAAAFPYAYTDLALKRGANHSDPLYFAVLAAGAALSLLSIFALALFARREQKSK